MLLPILYIGLSQSLFAAFVLFTKKHRKTADNILVLWLLVIALKFVILLIGEAHKEFFDTEFSQGYIPLTFGPFLYLYTRQLTNPEAKLRWADWLHAVPFILMTAFYFGFFKDYIEFNDTKYLDNDAFLGVRLIYAVVFVVSIFSYVFLTYRMLMSFRKSMSNEFSFQTDKNRLKWLSYISILISATFFVYFIIGVINALNKTQIFDASYITNVGLTILAFSVSYFGIKQPTLFREVKVLHHSPESAQTHDAQSDVTSAPATANETIEEKYHRSGLKPDEAEKILQKLLEYMENEKPYLNDELTIQELSAKLNVSKHHLTQVLNINLGKNFFTFINEYRIEAVKKRLVDPNYDHLTILGIAYDCGFNSKSSFNGLFKQYTGVTPSEYRKANS
jgi:AraC-like DNA-binding protein